MVSHESPRDHDARLTTSFKSPIYIREISTTAGVSVLSAMLAICPISVQRSRQGTLVVGLALKAEHYEVLNALRRNCRVLIRVPSDIVSSMAFSITPCT